METITMNGVDVDLLEEQRLTLNKTLHEYQEGDTLQLYNYEVEALRGILNMVDHWSDERYNKTKSRR